jgi:nucleoid-associated protein YgaU
MLMRKEVRLGLAIGGVLLAVVVVYVLVVTAGDDRPQTVTLEQNTEQGAAAPQAPTTSPQADPPLVAGGGTHLAQAQPQATPVNDPWTTALATGHVPVMLTETPAPATPSLPVPAEANLPTPSPGSGTLASSPPIAASNMGASLSSGGSERSIALPAPATQPAEPYAASPRTHVVREGESFATIAAAVYGNSSYYPHLIRANPTLDPRKLRPGMTINLPPVSEVRAVSPAGPAASNTPAAALDPRAEYRVSDGDSLEKISLKLYGKRDRVDKLYELNKAAIGPDPARLKIGMVLKLPEAPTATR